MPITRSGGKPVPCSATWHIASSGLVTTMMTRRRATAAACWPTAPTIPAFFASRSSRLMPGLRGQAGGHDDDLRVRGVGVVVGAGDPHVVSDDRGGLGEVQGLALGQSLHDVHENDVGEAGLDDLLGGRRADVAGADDGDLATENAGHGVLLPAAFVARARPWPGRSVLVGIVWPVYETSRAVGLPV